MGRRASHRMARQWSAPRPREAGRSEPHAWGPHQRAPQRPAARTWPRHGREVNPSNVLRVARRELRSIFGSPIGCIVAVLFLSLTGWLLFPTFFLQGRGDLRAFFELLPITLALVVPAITMRQLSEELSSGTYELVLTLPLSAAEILFGKFLGARGFLVAVLLPTLAYPISVSSVTRLDWGPVAGGYLGAFLLLGLYCAVGLLASSASRNQIVAFVLSLSACAFLALVDRVLFLIPAVLVAPLQFMSATFHVENFIENFARGVVDPRDVVYFVGLELAALFAAHAVMQVRRGVGG